jgi:hypothetical protein
MITVIFLLCVIAGLTIEQTIVKTSAGYAAFVGQ